MVHHYYVCVGGNSSGVLRELTDANDTIFDNRDRIFREVRKVC